MGKAKNRFTAQIVTPAGSSFEMTLREPNPTHETVISVAEKFVAIAKAMISTPE